MSALASSRRTKSNEEALVLATEAVNNTSRYSIPIISSRQASVNSSIASSIRSFTLRRENAAQSFLDLSPHSQCQQHLQREPASGIAFRSTSQDNMMMSMDDYSGNRFIDWERLDVTALSTFMNMLDYGTWMAQHLLQHPEEEIDSYLGHLQDRIAFGFKVLQVQAVLIVLNAFYTVIFLDTTTKSQDSAELPREDGSVALGALLLLVIVALVTRFLEFFSGISSLSNTGKVNSMFAITQKPSCKTIFKQLLRSHYHHLLTLHILILVCIAVQFHNDWILLSIVLYVIVWKVIAYYVLKCRFGVTYDKPLSQVQLLQTDLCQRVSFYLELMIGHNNHTTTTLYMIEYLVFAWLKYYLVSRQTLLVVSSSMSPFALNVQFLYPIYAMCDCLVIGTNVRLNMWKLLELYDASDPFVRLDKPLVEYSFGDFIESGVFHHNSAIVREFLQIRKVYHTLYTLPTDDEAAECGGDLQKRQTVDTVSIDFKDDEMRQSHGIDDVTTRLECPSREMNGVGSTAIMAMQV